MTITDNQELIINIDGKTQCITRKQLENAFSAPKATCANYERDNVEVENNADIKFIVKENTIFDKPNHYNNEGGSLYEFCERNKLNSYEFDCIKRIMRCRKKGQFKEDLEKTKFLIDLYLKEYGNSTKNN